MPFYSSWLGGHSRISFQATNFPDVGRLSIIEPYCDAESYLLVTIAPARHAHHTNDPSGNLSVFVDGRLAHGRRCRGRRSCG